MGRRAGMPVVFLPAGKTIYLCRFTVNGVRYRLSTGASDRGAAETAALELHAQARLGQLAPHKRIPPAKALDDSPPFDRIAARFLEWARAQGRAESYVSKQEGHLSRMGERWTRLGMITTEAIETFIADRRASVGSVTIYKELVTLSRFLRWCKRYRYIASVPEFDRIAPVSDYKPPDLTPEDVAALLNAMPTRHTHPKRMPVRERFMVQWAQGMRPGEVELVRWRDVDLRQGLLTIPPTHDKTRQGRTVGLAKSARAVLEELKAEREPLPTALIFGKRDLRVTIAKAVDAAGLPHVTPHHLRHARLSELASNTRDIPAVQFLAGHKRLSTTDRYVRSRTARTVALLEEADSGTQRSEKTRQRAPRKRGARK